METIKAKRKTRIGKVIADTMQKTRVVAVDTPWKHPVYNKTIKRVVKYYVHDEENKTKIGDTVRIEETRPLSRLKRWRVAELVIKGEVADIKPTEITT